MSNVNSSLTIRVGTVGIPGAMSQIQGLASSIVHSFGVSVFGIASVGGMALLTKQSIDLADTLGKTKQVVGLTMKEISGMSYAAQRSEVELGSLRIGLKTFSEWLAKNGQGSRNLKEALLEQAAAFQAMPDGINKTNRALELFGKSGTQMIPFLNDGADGLEKMFERGDRLNGITEDAAKSADEFNDAWSDTIVAARGLAGTMAFSLLPQITTFLNYTTDGIVSFREWTKESKTFDIALKSVAVTLGVLSAYKLGSMGVGVLAGFVGAGSVKNLRDFIALLQLTPAAATAAALALGKVAVAIGAITAAVTLAQGWWDYWKAQVQKTDAELAATQANEKLTESLHRRIAAEFAAGKISADEFKALKLRVIEANKLTDQIAQGQALRDIATENFPAGAAPDGKKLWSAEELDFQNKLLGVEIKRRDLMKERNRLAFDNTHTSAVINTGTGTQDGFNLGSPSQQVAKFDILKANLALMEAQRDSLMKQEQNAYKALRQGAIEQSKYDEIKLETNQKILAIDKERAETNKVLDTRSFSGSFNENMGADLENWSNVAGNVGTKAWDAVKLAVDGVSASIFDVIDGTKTWGQVSLQIGRQVIASFIQVGVQGLAAFTLSKTKELFIHLFTENAKTKATTTGAAIRSEAALGEAGAEAVNTGAKVAGSVGSIPYVGWALAIAAFGGIIAMIASASSAAKREHGGPVTAGQPYIVGEKRPELFVPTQSGTILPSVPDNYYQGVGGSQQSVNVSAAPVNVVVLDNETKLKRFLESRAGERVVVQHINNNRREVGLRS